MRRNEELAAELITKAAVSAKCQMSMLRGDIEPAASNRVRSPEDLPNAAILLRGIFVG